MDYKSRPWNITSAAIVLGRDNDREDGIRITGDVGDDSELKDKGPLVDPITIASTTGMLSRSRGKD